MHKRTLHLRFPNNQWAPASVVDTNALLRALANLDTARDKPIMLKLLVTTVLSKIANSWTSDQAWDTRVRMAPHMLRFSGITILVMKCVRVCLRRGC